MSSRVVLVSLGGSAAPGLAEALSKLDLSVTTAPDLSSTVSELADAALIVVEAADASSMALLSRRINDEAGSSHPPILAVIASGDVETRVKMLEAGADDVLAQPVDERELAATVDALMLRSSRPARAQPAAVSPAVPKPPSGPGRLIVFAAAKGGSGTTTLAVNCALALAEMAPGNVAIADLDMLHGQVSTHLDIYGRSSTADLAREDLYSYTAEMIAEAGRLHPGGLMVFGGPYRPDDGQGVTRDQLLQLVTALRGAYSTVVVDAGSTFEGRAMALANAADKLALVVTPDIPALRLLHAALETLSEMGNVAERATFVVNDIYPKSSISADQIEEHLAIKVGLTVPYDSETFLRAVNEGQPIVTLARRSAAAIALRKLAELLADAAMEETAPKPQKRGRLGGLLGRS